MVPLPTKLLESLRREAAAAGDGWPAGSLNLFQEFDVFRLGVPAEFGGRGSCDDLTAAYIDLAAADLTACFVLTQHNSAVSRLVAADSDSVRSRWLPRLAAGEALATVGISHLTTSRQHIGKAAVRAEETEDGYILNGVVPWSTGAARADAVVVGGTLPSGEEILVVVQTDHPGWRPAEPMPLLALTGSETGEIVLDRVHAADDALVAGPVQGVMKSGAGGAGSLTTSALAVGVAQRAVQWLEDEGARRDDIRDLAQQLEQELDEARASVLAKPGEQKPSAEVRSAANSLALRSTQAMMTAAKGAGFVQGHPAERAVREAMFFLVWSCPRPVAEAAMQEFQCRPFCSP